MTHEPFDPVVLDLADPHEYVVLVSALEQYATARRVDAATADSQTRAARLRTQEARARELIRAIDRQIVANAETRNATN